MRICGTIVLSAALGLGLLLFSSRPLRAQGARAATVRADSGVATTPAPVARPRAGMARVSHDWLSDRRMLRVGDLVTVLVDEYALASANKTSTASQDRNLSNKLGASAAGATMNKGANVALSTGSSVSSSDRGQTLRQDRLTAEVTVRVDSIDSAGLAHVEGSKQVVLDDQVQRITLKGLLRPADVMAGNVVDSWRLADVRIAYVPKGKLGKPHRSILAAILGIIWP